MRKLATIRTVHETRAIEGGDLIEMALVDGWKCVTKIGEFAVGDDVIYCEIDSYRGKAFYVSEKIDGTSFTAFLNEGSFGVCGRNWQLAEDMSNRHWQVARELNLQARMESLGRSLAIQGELAGPRIQKNRYELKSPTVFVFNVFDIAASTYVEKTEMEAICESLDP